YILADTLEAFIGAAYLDQGFAFCENFIKERIVKNLPYIIKTGLYKDAKSKFQEKSQEITGITPSYKVIEESGPDHAKNFLIGVYLDKECIAEGRGSSKQEAEDSAARHALEIKNWQE
ncbi:MAG: putative dsRNA-binding protein, partial [bacterium]